MKYAVLLIPFLTGCASSYTHIEHVTVLTSVGAGCEAIRGSQTRREADGQADVAVLTQDGATDGTGAIAALLESRVGCD